MVTKTDKAKELFKAGEITSALRIFKGFKAGFTRQEKRALEIAYESQTGKSSFYQNLGIDTKAMISEANSIIKRIYNL